MKRCPCCNGEIFKIIETSTSLRHYDIIIGSEGWFPIAGKEMTTQFFACSECFNEFTENDIDRWNK